MNLQDLKRIHWLAIGAVVGALLSYSRLYNLTSGERVTPEDGLTERRQTISADELIAELQRAPADAAKPGISRLTLYPPVNNTVYVLGSVMRPNLEAPDSYRQIVTSASIPFRPANRPSPGEGYSLADEIKSLAKNNPQIVCRYAWWTAPSAVIGLWGGGSVVLIGLIWPTLINLAVGAGLAPKRVSREEKKRDAAYLASIKSEAEPQAPKLAVTASDTAALRKLTDVMQSELQAAAIEPQPVSHDQQTGSAPVRKLESGPLEKQVVIEQPKEEVDWGGEFYPVAHPHHKPNSPAAGEASKKGQ
jgi:hypothetical protein